MSALSSELLLRLANLNRIADENPERWKRELGQGFADMFRRRLDDVDDATIGKVLLVVSDVYEASMMCDPSCVDQAAQISQLRLAVLDLTAIARGGVG